jgi:hypothetical protein
MSRKSWKKGYDFEKGRQAHRDEKKIEAGLGRAFELLISGSKGGILFVILLILLFLGAGWNEISNHKILSSPDIRMEHNIEKWVARSNLIENLSPFENCDYDISLKAYDIKTIEYTAPIYKEKITWAIIKIYFIVNGQKQDATTLILQGDDGLKSYVWRIAWRSDQDEIIYGPSLKSLKHGSEDDNVISDKYNIENMLIAEPYVIFISITPLNSCEQTAILYTTDNGKTWILDDQSAVPPFLNWDN